MRTPFLMLQPTYANRVLMSSGFRSVLLRGSIGEDRSRDQFPVELGGTTPFNRKYMTKLP